jgi:hypothetical protein
LPKPSQQTPPIITVGSVGRRGKKGDGHAPLQIGQKALGIVVITPAMVPASLNARAADNTPVKIHLYLDLATIAVNNIRALNGANPDTTIAPYALGNIICYQFAHYNTRPPLL